MTHPKKVEGFNGTLEELAKNVGNMTYDQTARFIQLLAKDLEKQAEEDLKNGRKKLANKLYGTAEGLNNAYYEMNDAWKICKYRTQEQ